MQIARRIEIEGMRLDDGEDGVEPGKEKSDEEIDADCTEDRFRLGFFARKDAAKDHSDGKSVKCEAENDIEDGYGHHPGLKNDGVRRDRGERKKESDHAETPAEAHGVYAHQRDGGAHQPARLLPAHAASAA